MLDWLRLTRSNPLKTSGFHPHVAVSLLVKDYTIVRVDTHHPQTETVSKRPYLDSEKLLHETFDPARVFRGDTEQVIDHVARRRGSIDHPVLGNLSPLGTMALDLTYIGADAVELPMKSNERQAIVAYGVEHTNTIAALSKLVSERMTEEYLETQTARDKGLTRETLSPLWRLGSMTLSSVAHRTQERKTTKRPYAHHTFDADGIQTVARKQTTIPYSRLPWYERAANATVNHLHDAFEDTYEADGTHHETQPVVIGPRTGRAFLGSFNDMPLDTATDTLVALNRITHFEDIDGNTLPYQDYVDQLIQFGGEKAEFAKLGDTQQNTVHEPDLRFDKRVIAKRENYREAQRRIIASRYRQGDIAGAELAFNMTTISAADLSKLSDKEFPRWFSPARAVELFTVAALSRNIDMRPKKR